MTACWATPFPLRERPNRCSTLTQRETTRPHVKAHHTCRQQSARRPPRYEAPKHRLGRAQTHQKPLKTSWPTRSVVPVPSPTGSAKSPTTRMSHYRPPSRAYKLRNTQFGGRTCAILLAFDTFGVRRPTKHCWLAEEALIMQSNRATAVGFVSADDASERQ